MSVYSTTFHHIHHPVSSTKKELVEDAKQKAKVSTFPLELMVGTVKVSRNTSQELIAQLSKTSISPRLFLVK